MRYPAADKLEIIRLVEQSHLPVRRTLDKIGIPVGRKNPIWRFRSMKLGDKLFLRPRRGGVDRCING